MATKLEKCARTLNDEFPDQMMAAFKEKFGRDLETSFNIFSMQLVSQPADGEPFTPEQKHWVTAFDSGYSAAMEIARRLAGVA